MSRDWRLEPGNLRKEAEIKQVAAEAGTRRTHPHRRERRLADPDLYKKYGGATPEALVELARAELALFEEVGFNDVKISVKASSVALMIAAYRLASETFDHPLHLGVTEAGPTPGGLIKGTAGIATLLAEGIGDTIRYSLTADPVEEAGRGASSSRRSGCGSARGSTSSPAPLWTGPGGRDRRGQGGAGGSRRSCSCPSRWP